MMFFVGLAAYAVKAATGFGPAVIVVGVGSLIIGVQEAIILSAILDVLSGAAVVGTTSRPGYDWKWLAVGMTVGVAAGAVLLLRIASGVLGPVVAVMIFIAGVILIFRGRLVGEGQIRLTSASVPVDTTAGALAGLSGGFVGMGGPPLVVYLKSRLAPDAFRSVLVRVLLVAAIFRTVSYAVGDAYDVALVGPVVLTTAAMPVGLWLGHRTFAHLHERQFNRTVGGVLVVSAVAGFIR